GIATTRDNAALLIAGMDAAPRTGRRQRRRRPQPSGTPRDSEQVVPGPRLRRHGGDRRRTVARRGARPACGRACDLAPRNCGSPPLERLRLLLPRAVGESSRWNYDARRAVVLHG